MSVGLVAAAHPAREGLLSGVDVHVLLPVAGVGEAPIAAVDLALKWLLTCNKRYQICIVKPPFVSICEITGSYFTYNTYNTNEQCSSSVINPIICRFDRLRNSTIVAQFDLDSRT